MIEINPSKICPQHIIGVIFLLMGGIVIYQLEVIISLLSISLMQGNKSDNPIYMFEGPPPEDAIILDESAPE